MDSHFFFDWYAYACYDLVYYGYCGYASFDDCATVRTERIVIGQCIDVLVTCVQWFDLSTLWASCIGLGHRTIFYQVFFFLNGTYSHSSNHQMVKLSPWDKYHFKIASMCLHPIMRQSFDRCIFLFILAGWSHQANSDFLVDVNLASGFCYSCSLRKMCSHGSPVKYDDFSSKQSVWI